MRGIDMKKLIFLLVSALLFVGLLTGCNGVTTPEATPQKADLQISITPNPVPYIENWGWEATITISVKNNVGVTINKEEVKVYGVNDPNSVVTEATLNTQQLEDIFGTVYISPNSSFDVEFYWSDDSPASKIVYTLYGVDDNGNSIEATLTVNLESKE